MKETINISIAGISFVIEKEAKEKLNDYINQVEQHFLSQGEEGNEIIADIESRIAEIFLSKRQSVSEAITFQCVNEVIEQMGIPESVAEEPSVAGYDYETEIKKKEVVSKVKRYLYRNPNGSIFGGVLNGLASYFGLDVVWLRVALVMLLVGLISFGLPGNIGKITALYIILFYLVLRIIVPKAKTTLQKLEMEGRQANISNIETEYQKDEKTDRYKKQITNSLSILSKVIKAIMIVVVGFMFLAIICVVIGVLFSVMGIFVFPDFLTPFFVWNPTLSILSAAVVVLIPCVILATVLIGMLRSNINISRAFYVICAILWVTALITVGIASMKDFYARNTSNSYSQTIYNSSQTDQLYFKPMTSSQFRPFSGSDLHSFDNTIFINKSIFNIHCHNSNDSEIKVIFSFKARGINKDMAMVHAEQIIIPYEVVEDTIYISPVFKMKENKYYEQRVSVDVYVPVGKSVVADPFREVRFWYGKENGNVSIYKNTNQAKESKAKKNPKQQNKKTPN